jgi:hypothetical protein
MSEDARSYAGFSARCSWIVLPCVGSCWGRWGLNAGSEQGVHRPASVFSPVV